jgi:CSLREA domain-containing protein
MDARRTAASTILVSKFWAVASRFLSLLAWLTLAAATARANTIVVNSAADVVADDGQCTLREAIIAANTHVASGISPNECAAGDPGGNIINFNIPGAGVHTIKPLSALPAITGQLLIDGTTQPGASPNTNPYPGPLNAVLLIEIDNTNAPFSIDAPIVTLRGLVLNRGLDNVVVNADNAVIVGCYIGTDPTGTVALPNPGGGYGIRMNGTRQLFYVGYSGISLTNDRNLISGNAQGGILSPGGAYPDGTPSGLIIGNFIGTDATGTVALAQPGSVGLTVSNVLVESNLISGHPLGGLDIPPPGNVIMRGECSFPVVPGNLVGVQRDGVTPMPNGGFGGVRVRGSNCQIGGTGCDVISFNNGYGVDVFPGTTGSYIKGGSIYGNARLGISLTDTSLPLPNDACDGDAGPGNLGQNVPVITVASINGPGSTVIGTINSTANTTFEIDIYSTDVCDPSGSGQGKTYLGSVAAVTDGTCTGGFLAFLTAPPVGQTIFMATATDVSSDPNGHRITSEFSACFPAPAPAPARVFVSTTGSDANPCGLTTPCRTIGRALMVVATEGEVVVLNSGGYGPFIVYRAVSVVVPDGIYAGITSLSGDAVTVSAGSTDVVTLKGLTLNSFGGANGVRFAAGSALVIENSSIGNFIDGIRVEGAGSLEVRNTRISGSNSAGVFFSPSSLANVGLIRCRLSGNAAGLALLGAASVGVEECVIAGNVGAGISCPVGAVAVDDCLISGNGTGASASGSGILLISDSCVTDNGVGLAQTPGGVLRSRINNTVEGNGTNTTGTILTFAGK